MISRNAIGGYTCKRFCGYVGNAVTMYYDTYTKSIVDWILNTNIHSALAFIKTRVCFQNTVALHHVFDMCSTNFSNDLSYACWTKVGSGWSDIIHELFEVMRTCLSKMGWHHWSHYIQRQGWFRDGVYIHAYIFTAAASFTTMAQLRLWHK